MRIPATEGIVSPGMREDLPPREHLLFGKEWRKKAIKLIAKHDAQKNYLKEGVRLAQLVVV